MEVTKKKTIWMVSAYTQPPLYDTHLRHNKFARKLIECGFDVYIITSNIIHGTGKKYVSGSKGFCEVKYDEVSYIHINTIDYNNSTIKRILSLFLFSVKLYLLKTKIAPQPDFIIHNLHAPIDSLIYYVAKYFKAKYITEVWDLWPESFVSFGLVGKKNLLMKLAYLVEKFSYRKADKMIFTMEGASQYIIDKKWDINNGGPIDLNKVCYINNGVDIKEFEFNKQQYIYNDVDLDNNDSFNIVYLGSIRTANNVKLIIDVAELLADTKRIKFLIFGDGNQRMDLEEYCRANNINNVIFKDKWVNIKYVPSIVSKSNLNLLNYKYNDIERYGGSQGKLFQYLAAGKPIVSNININYSPILKYNAGISEDLDSPEKYKEAILRIYALPKREYVNICNNALLASTEFDYNILAQKNASVVETL